MDINWDQIQQILTFLIIFIAPAILQRFKKEEDPDEEEKETILTRLQNQDFAGTKPIKLKALREESEEGLTRTMPEKAPPKKGVSSKNDKASAPVQKTYIEREKAKPSIPIYKQKARETLVEKTPKSKSLLLGMSARKAMILKEVLDKPRGFKPY